MATAPFVSSYFRILPGILIVLIAGCASFRPQTCEQFDAKRKQTNYATEYRRDAGANVKPLYKGAALAVEYDLSVDTDRAYPCSHVMIRKELTLTRRQDAGGAIDEIWEFYAEDGTRITIKNENLNSQLRQSGRYVASVPLPIPRGAPPGRYYVISTLTLRTRGDTHVLAKTSASFDVVYAGK
jgi:hypothetical protein